MQTAAGQRRYTGVLGVGVGLLALAVAAAGCGGKTKALSLTPTSAPATSAPATSAPPPTLSPVPVTSSSGTTSSPGGGTVSLGSGITLTLAPGWTVANQRSGEALVRNPRNVARLFTVVSTASSSDIKTDLEAGIRSEGSAQSLSTSGYQVINVTGNFNQVAQESYVETVGGSHYTGVFLELLNTSSMLSAYVDAYALTDAEYRNNEPAIHTMILSMING